MGKTKISWTNETWNPVTGCSKVSPGCANCYAERMDRRIRAAHGEEFKLWTPQNAEYNVRLHPERLHEPFHWKKPRMVFVNSMSDLFHEEVPESFIADVFASMSHPLARKHTFQILTKRPARMLEIIKRTKIFGITLAHEPLPNVWLGVSVENQHAADERIALLLQTPAAIRFLSCEPLLEKVTIPEVFLKKLHFDGRDWNYPDNAGMIDWVIVGGESGPNFRPMRDEWARSIRNQCHDAGVPFFFKQHSGYRPQENALLDGVEYHEFPEIAEQ